MDNFKTEVIDFLRQVKGSGKYVISLIHDFVFPDLEVNKIGELSYPINEKQAKSLIEIAHKAPFGMGHETVVDDKIRSAWEIDSHEISFKSENWTKFLQKVVSKIKKDLDLETFEIEAHLYKMLVYEPGDFFYLIRIVKRKKVCLER